MVPSRLGESRRVLMLAYFFPPLAGAGVQRTLKFVKYLPAAGWWPSVITTRSRLYPSKDETLAREIPPTVEVTRAREPRGAMGPATVLKWIGLERASQVAAFPDWATAWAPDALRLALRAVREQRPAVLFSTSAPYTAHLVAAAVHERTGIPWVADFRDEWAGNPAMRAAPALVHRAARRAEREITTRATAVTVVEGYFDLLNPSGSPVIAIPNGIDEEDLADLGDGGGDRRMLTLSYVGTIYGEQDPTVVFDALARLIHRGAIDAARIRVRLVGNDLRPGSRGRWPVPVEQLGYVDHGRALREMRSASVLLHYVAAASPAPAGKLYEYLASQRPILCVTRPDGVAARIVREAGAGQVAPPDDPAAIESALLSLYERWRADGLPDQPHAREWVLAHHSRRKLAGDLAGVLARAADGSPTSRRGAG